MNGDGGGESERSRGCHCLYVWSGAVVVADCFLCRRRRLRFLVLVAKVGECMALTYRERLPKGVFDVTVCLKAIISAVFTRVIMGEEGVAASSSRMLWYSLRY